MSYQLGLDRSGNGNNWTVNNLSLTDQMLDTPTNNFAVMNSLRPNCSTAFREGNLYLRDSGSVMGVSTILPETGKWYWEVDPQDRYAGTPQYGIATEEINNETEVGSNLDGVKINAYAGGNRATIYGTGTLHGSVDGWPSDYIWGFALDNDNGKLWVSRNGSWTYILSGGNPSTGTNPTASGLPTGYPIFGNIGSDSTTYNAYIRVNFGADGTFFGNQTSGGHSDDNGYGDFKYDVPTGFLALCTKNLPDPAVKPSEHFNTVLYSGNGSARTISGVGFQPDWNWTKPTNNSGSHVLTDAVRGNTKFLESNSTGAEQTTSSGITAFNSDGYTLGTGNDWNVNSDTFVSWNWKANGSGSSNTNGSITSTVSANVDAGFSIVTYTGNATEGATVGHGLSKAPEVMLVKKRSGAAGWYMYHKDLGPTKNIELQVTSAASTTSNIWNDTAPTSSVFSLGNNAAINGTGATFVAYCFHSVDGYSKIGSYSGNGSTDGTFIYTGFRPAYVQWKKSSDSGTIWQIFGYAGQAGSTAQSNPLDRYVSANSGGSEGDYDFVDFLSNGFKLRHNSGHANTDSQTYIYIAFAETPLKNSNAR